MKETWNPAEISEDIKPVNYVRSDSWNAAELNEAIDLFGIKYPVDTWNPAELDEKARNVINDITSTKTITGNPISFKTINGGYAKSCEVTMNPIQDLNGYDYPWAGGAGKNKLQVTETSKTINGVTFTVNSDGTIKANGTANADSRINFGVYIAKAQSSQIMNGLPDSVTDNTIDMGYQGYGVINKITRELVINRSADTDWSNAAYILIKSGTTVNNLVFKPMIRLSTETDATFAPYSNICPISGRDSLHLYQDTEQTETPETTHTAIFSDTVYGGKLDFVSGKAKSEWGYIESYDGETITEPWISSIDVYSPNTSPSTGAEVCYKLATQQEITLTPETIALLKGNNTMWTDGDSVTLKYTKLVLPDDSDGLSLTQKVKKAIEIIKGKEIKETKKSTTKGRRKKS